MIDKIILIICGVLFVLLTAILIWWLVTGKQRFIEKRCPERLNKVEQEQDKNNSERSMNE